MSDTTIYSDEQEIVDQKAIELAEDFSYDGYQVVRRELFAHLWEPAVVIRRDSVTFNTACIAGLEDAVYIQILVNQENKRMVVRKCEENDKDALRWCVAKPDKRKSRQLCTGKGFTEKEYPQKQSDGWRNILAEPENVQRQIIRPYGKEHERRRRHSACADKKHCCPQVIDIEMSHTAIPKRKYISKSKRKNKKCFQRNAVKSIQIQFLFHRAVEGKCRCKTDSNQREPSQLPGHHADSCSGNSNRKPFHF